MIDPFFPRQVKIASGQNTDSGASVPKLVAVVARLGEPDGGGGSCIYLSCILETDRASQRVRRVLQRAKGGGRQCRGGNRERRPCNDVPCTTTTTTTTTTTSTTTRSTTTTRRPRPTTFPTTFAPRRQSPTTFPPRRPLRTTRPTRRPTTRRPTTTTRRPPTTTTAVRIRDPNARVECYVCGSLFSTDAPDCPR